MRVERIHKESLRLSRQGSSNRASAYAASVPMMSAHAVEATVTIALVSTDRYVIGHQAELNDKAQELKEHGKGIAGSVVVGERRTRIEEEPRRDVA